MVPTSGSSPVLPSLLTLPPPSQFSLPKNQQNIEKTHENPTISTTSAFPSTYHQSSRASSTLNNPVYPPQTTTIPTPRLFVPQSTTPATLSPALSARSGLNTHPSRPYSASKQQSTPHLTNARISGHQSSGNVGRDGEQFHKEGQFCPKLAHYDPLQSLTLKNLVDLIIDYADTNEEFNKDSSEGDGVVKEQNKIANPSELFSTVHYKPTSGTNNNTAPSKVTNLRALILVYMAEYQKLKNDLKNNSKKDDVGASSPAPTQTGISTNTTPSSLQNSKTDNDANNDKNNKNTLLNIEKKDETNHTLEQVLRLQLSRSLASYALLFCLSAYLRDITSLKHMYSRLHWEKYQFWLHEQRSENGEDYALYDYTTFPTPPLPISPYTQNPVGSGASLGNNSNSNTTFAAPPTQPNYPTFSDWLAEHREVAKLLLDIFISPEHTSKLVQSTVPPIVLATRCGEILTPQDILKSDQFAAIINRRLGQIAPGVINFRLISNNYQFGLKCSGFHVGGAGIPSISGLLLLLRYLTYVGVGTANMTLTAHSNRELPIKTYPIFEQNLGESSSDSDDENTPKKMSKNNNDFSDYFPLPTIPHASTKPAIDRLLTQSSNARVALRFDSVLWLNLREEPVIYVAGNPFVLRLGQTPFQNLEQTGINSSKVILMEDKLRNEAQLEADINKGSLYVHEEADNGNLVGEFVNTRILQDKLTPTTLPMVSSLSNLGEVKKKSDGDEEVKSNGGGSEEKSGGGGGGGDDDDDNNHRLVSTPKTLGTLHLRPADNSLDNIDSGCPSPLVMNNIVLSPPISDVDDENAFDDGLIAKQTVHWSEQQQQAYALLQSFTYTQNEQLFDVLPSVELPEEAYSVSYSREHHGFKGISTDTDESASNSDTIDVNQTVSPIYEDEEGEIGNNFINFKKNGKRFGDNYQNGYQNESSNASLTFSIPFSHPSIASLPSLVNQPSNVSNRDDDDDDGDEEEDDELSDDGMSSDSDQSDEKSDKKDKNGQKSDKKNKNNKNFIEFDDGFDVVIVPFDHSLDKSNQNGHNNHTPTRMRSSSNKKLPNSNKKIRFDENEPHFDQNNGKNNEKNFTPKKTTTTTLHKNASGSYTPGSGSIASSWSSQVKSTSFWLNHDDGSDEDSDEDIFDINSTPSDGADDVEMNNNDTNDDIGIFSNRNDHRIKFSTPGAKSLKKNNNFSKNIDKNGANFLISSPLPDHLSPIDEKKRTAPRSDQVSSIDTTPYSNLSVQTSEIDSIGDNKLTKNTAEKTPTTNKTPQKTPTKNKNNQVSNLHITPYTPTRFGTPSISLHQNIWTPPPPMTPVASIIPNWAPPSPPDGLFDAKIPTTTQTLQNPSSYRWGQFTPNIPNSSGQSYYDQTPAQPLQHTPFQTFGPQSHHQTPYTESQSFLSSPNQVQNQYYLTSPQSHSLLTCEEVWTWCIQRVYSEHSLLKLPIPSISYSRTPVTDEQAPTPSTINDIIHAVCTAIVRCPLITLDFNPANLDTIVVDMDNKDQYGSLLPPKDGYVRGRVFNITNLIIMQNCQAARGRTTTSQIVTSLILDSLYDIHYIYNESYNWKTHHQITEEKIIEKYNVYLELQKNKQEKNDENCENCENDDKKNNQKQKHLSFEEIAFIKKAKDLGVEIPERSDDEEITFRQQQRVLEEGLTPSIRKLVAILPHGELYKFRTDILIDVAGDMQNLRKCLETTYQLYLQTLLLFPTQAHVNQHRGKNYLVRYIVLLLTGAYLYQGGAKWYFEQVLNLEIIKREKFNHFYNNNMNNNEQNQQQNEQNNHQHHHHHHNNNKNHDNNNNSTHSITDRVRESVLLSSTNSQTILSQSSKAISKRNSEENFQNFENDPNIHHNTTKNNDKTNTKNSSTGKEIKINPKYNPQGFVPLTVLTPITTHLHHSINTINSNDQTGHHYYPTDLNTYGNHEINHQVNVTFHDWLNNYTSIRHLLHTAKFPDVE
jgi:hypothetical protein